MAILGAIPLDLDTVVLDLFDSTTAGNTISAGNGRSSGNSLRITTNGANITKGIGSNLATLNVALGLQVASLTTPGTSGFLSFTDAGTAQVTLKVLADGTIQAYRGTGSGTLLGASSAGVVVAAAYQHIECTVTISATVGVVQVWVNSVSVLNLTSQNTKSTANTTVSGFTLFAYTSVTCDFCDIIWAGARINDRRVECVVPTGAGNYAQFTPSAGSNWQNVDEVPPNTDTDYNETATLNNIDSFAHGALAGTPSTIDAVIVNVRARNTTSGAGSVAPFLRSSTTDSVGTGVSLNTTYQDFQSVYLTDPATGSAWASAAAVNAAEIGYKKTV